jgi:hypothetical protein
MLLKLNYQIWTTQSYQNLKKNMALKLEYQIFEL